MLILYLCDEMLICIFQLQISRTQTIIGQLHGDGVESTDRLAQLRRYAAIHNPHTSSKPPLEKLKPLKHRQVSIPGGHGESSRENKDMLFIGGPLGAKEKPAFTSEATERDRADLERLPPRKLNAAGIVKMYLNKSDIVGAVENPLYTTLSDGRGHTSSIMDSDSLIVQPLLKKNIGKKQLPAIETDNNGNKVKTTLPSIAQKKPVQREQFDVIVGNVSRCVGPDHVVESRVS